MPGLSEEGRAKVNLTLRVVGRRVDGYHDLESVVAFADCADRLSLTPGSRLLLKTTGPLARDCGATADNLVFKAAQLLGERVPDLRFGEFTLDKVLPVAAGIGGGSADAAAALRLLAQANGLALDDARLIEVAQLTGADVPVCLASRACVMTGVGETLLPLSLPKMPCVMVNPRLPLATRDVFDALGLRNGELLVARPTCFKQPPGRRKEHRLKTGLKYSLPVPTTSKCGNAHSACDRRGALGAQRHQWGLAGADVGVGRYLLCDLREHRRSASRGAEIQIDHPQWWVHAGVLS